MILSRAFIHDECAAQYNQPSKSLPSLEKFADGKRSSPEAASQTEEFRVLTLSWILAFTLSMVSEDSTPRLAPDAASIASAEFQFDILAAVWHSATFLEKVGSKSLNGSYSQLWVISFRKKMEVSVMYILRLRITKNEEMWAV